MAEDCSSCEAANEFIGCNHNLTYKRRPGTDNKGCDYELYLTALFAIRLALDYKVQDALIATNVEDYGNFDDIVIKVMYKDGSVKLYVIQLKHRTSQSHVDFINRAKNDFSLEKYKDGYHKYVAPQVGQDDLSKGVELKDVISCLFTNAAISKNTKSMLLDKRTSLSCRALNCLIPDFVDTTPEGHHTFEMHTERPKFTNFLNSYLVTSYQKRIKTIVQKLENQLSDVIKKIGKRFENQLKTDTGDMNFDDILTGVDESVMREIVESDLSQKIFAEVSDYFRKEFQSARDVHEQYSWKCEEYSEFFQKFRFYGNQLDYGRVLQAINDSIRESFGIFNPEVARKFIKYIQDYFEGDRLLSLSQVKKNLLELLRHSEDNLEKRFRIFQMVTNLNDPQQKLMVSKHIKVSMQGRKAVDLCDAVDPNFCRKLEPKFLLKYMGGVVSVGKKLELQCENYIKRKFCNAHVKRDILWQLKTCIFIVSVSETSDLACCIPHWVKVINLMDGQDLHKNFPGDSKNYVILITNRKNADERAKTLMELIIAKGYSVCYLKENGSLLEWKGWKRGLNFKSDASSTSQDLIEEDLQHFLQFSSSTVKIISADSGMGKSTVLDSLIQYCPSNKWVLKVSLNQFNADLHDKHEEILRDPLRYIYKNTRGVCDDEFSSDLFDYMKNRDEVIVFIDAFDEIAPRYTCDVVALISKLEELRISTWVFTQPNLKDCLEKNFNTKAIGMVPLSQDEIRGYLLKSIRNPPPECFLQKMIDFVKLPLHLSMFSTILCNENLNWNDLQVTDLYENFITTKCDIYYKKFGIDMRRNHVENMVLSTEDLIKDHQLLSLLLIYGKDFLVEHKIANPSEIIRLLRDIKKYNNHVGLVSAVHGSTPIFCHRNYAEYLTAKWLSSNTSHKIFKQMYERLFESNFEVVRFLFDKIVTRPYPLHAAVVDGNLQLVRELCNQGGLDLCDNLRRTPLHIAVSYFKHNNLFGSEESCEENEVACKILNEICEYFSEKKMVVAQRDFLGRRWYKCIPLYVEFELLLFTACYWGCKAVIMMYSTKKRLLSDLDVRGAIKYIIQGGHIDCLTLLLICNVYDDIEEIKRLILSSDSSQLSILALIEKLSGAVSLAAEHKVNEYLLEHFKSDLVYVLKFFIVNAEPFQSYEQDSLKLFIQKCSHSINPGREFFKERFFNQQVFNELLDCTEKKLITGSKNCLEALENRLGLASIREKLNILERVDVATKMHISGCTPLCAAAFSGHLNAVKVMANTSDKVNVIPGDKFIPLHCAVEGGNTKVITWLIRAGAKVNQVDANGNTALTHLYCFPDSIVQRHLSLVDEIDQNLNGAEYNSISSFLENIEKDKLNHVKVFVENGANVTIKNHRGKSCFGLAVEYGHWEILKLFVESGVYVDYRDNEEELTALHKSIQSNRPDYAMYFLHKKASVKMKVGVKTALDLALENQSICWRTVVTLIERGADINCRQNKKGYTPLHYAVKENRLDIVKYLVNKGANVIITDGLVQWTPVQLARYLGKEDIVKYFARSFKSPSVTLNF